mmetsp:Transcript_116520/g.340937  ORF Transcript_116520/g.340937 Transcript_116520/m.340937 type:complete len:267 (+) Transcript_116520:410-1210(+)
MPDSICLLAEHASGPGSLAVWALYHASRVPHSRISGPRTGPRANDCQIVHPCHCASAGRARWRPEPRGAPPALGGHCAGARWRCIERVRSSGSLAGDAKSGNLHVAPVQSGLLCKWIRVCLAGTALRGPPCPLHRRQAVFARGGSCFGRHCLSGRQRCSTALDHGHVQVVWHCCGRRLLHAATPRAPVAACGAPRGLLCAEYAGVAGKGGLRGNIFADPLWTVSVSSGCGCTSDWHASICRPLGGPAGGRRRSLHERHGWLAGHSR